MIGVILVMQVILGILAHLSIDIGEASVRATGRSNISNASNISNISNISSAQHRYR